MQISLHEKGKGPTSLLQWEELYRTTPKQIFERHENNSRDRQEEFHYLLDTPKTIINFSQKYALQNPYTIEQYLTIVPKTKFFGEHNSHIPENTRKLNQTISFRYIKNGKQRKNIEIAAENPEVYSVQDETNTKTITGYGKICIETTLLHNPISNFQGMQKNDQRELEVMLKLIKEKYL